MEALRCLLQKRPDEARHWLDRYQAPERELLRGLLGLAVRLSEQPVRHTDPQDADAMLAQLDQLREPLRPQAALTVRKMSFCKWIERYGDYEPLPDGHQFRAGDLVHIYVELSNFTSARQGSVYVTRLASTLEILDAAGTIVWRQDLGDRDRPERSHTLWRDYFRNYRFYLPEKMPPGLYTLRIHVTDVPTERTARGSLDFRVTTVPARGS